MKASLFADIPAELPEEFVETLISGKQLRIERIVSRGHHSAPDFWYDQSEHEAVVLLSGGARLRFAEDDRLITLQAGDYLNIPAHCRHRVEWTTPDEDSVWLAIFYRD